MEPRCKNIIFNQVLKLLRLKITFALTLILFVTACSENYLNDDNLDNDMTVLSQSLNQVFGKIGISDAANDGIDEFYFMAPTIGGNPKHNGKFHPNLSPIVEISDDFNFKNFHKVYQKNPNSEDKVNVNHSEEFYFADWDLAATNAQKGKIYRIRIRINERILGFVDIGVVPKGTKTLSNGLIPAIEDQTFRIAFRIEEKNCPARIVIEPTEASIFIGQEKQFKATAFNFYDEPLEGLKFKWEVENGTVASISQTGLAKGVAGGETQISAQTNDVKGYATLVIEDLQENELGTLTDPRDGKTYKTVRIGNQIWMAENLNYDPFSQGCAYSDDNDNDEINCPTLGREYHYWSGSSNRCPDGWHIPTYDDWVEFINILGGWKVEPKKDFDTFTSYQASDLAVSTLKSTKWWTTQAEAVGGGIWWSSTVHNNFDDYPSQYAEEILDGTDIVFYHYFRVGGLFASFDNTDRDYTTACRCIKD